MMVIVTVTLMLRLMMMVTVIVTVMNDGDASDFCSEDGGDGDGDYCSGRLCGISSSRNRRF